MYYYNDKANYLQLYFLCHATPVNTDFCLFLSNNDVFYYVHGFFFSFLPTRTFKSCFWQLIFFLFDQILDLEVFQWASDNVLNIGLIRGIITGNRRLIREFEFNKD